MVGTVFGALAFTVISFTCVAPFLGGFAGISAADSGGGSLIAMPTTKEVLGGLAFATAFAAPFFVLALVPGLLKALPKSGGWLDSVKVVMGFLELAAALKFFRTAELGCSRRPQYFTYDLVLAGWVAIALACGLYLLNVYRLPHDEEKPNIGVPRLLFALLFLGLGVYLLPALFKGADGKPSGRPARSTPGSMRSCLPEPKHLGWSTDLHEAIASSRGRRRTGKSKPIFVDFTGVTCTNCKYNENTVFPQPKVRRAARQVRAGATLHRLGAGRASTRPTPGEHARDGRRPRPTASSRSTCSGTDQLPLYAILVPHRGRQGEGRSAVRRGEDQQPRPVRGVAQGGAGEGERRIAAWDRRFWAHRCRWRVLSHPRSRFPDSLRRRAGERIPCRIAFCPEGVSPVRTPCQIGADRPARSVGISAATLADSYLLAAIVAVDARLALVISRGRHGLSRSDARSASTSHIADECNTSQVRCRACDRAGRRCGSVGNQVASIADNRL